MREKQAKQLKEPEIAHIVRQFRSGDLVWTQDYRSRSSKWTEGVIDSALGPVTYQVRVENYLWKRHIDQLKARVPTDMVMEEMVVIPEPLTQSPHPVQEPIVSLVTEAAHPSITDHERELEQPQYVSQEAEAVPASTSLSTSHRNWPRVRKPPDRLDLYCTYSTYDGHGLS